MLPTPHTLRRAIVVAGLCLAVAPAAASADSLVFIKSGSVWLSHSDGSGAYQVTSGGNYRSPTQADDGTIAVGHGDDIVRMTQNGTVLTTIDPPALTNSVGHPVDGPAVDVAISPDGRRIAYTFVGYECPTGASCGARSATGYTAADHYTAGGGTTYFRDPSRVTSTRTLQFGGYGSQVNIHDVGGAATHWFDDSDYADRRPTSPTARRAARAPTSRSCAATARTRGSSGTPSPTRVPARRPSRTRRRAAPPARGRAGGTELVARRLRARARVEGRDLGQAGGTRLRRPARAGGPRRLGARLGPGRCQPGAAGRWVEAARGRGSSPSSGGVTVGPLPTPATMRVARVKLAKALRSGLKITLRGATPGRQAIVAKRGRKVVARGIATVGACGAAKVTLRFTRAGKRALRGARTVRLTVLGGGAKVVVMLKR